MSAGKHPVWEVDSTRDSHASPRLFSFSALSSLDATTRAAVGWYGAILAALSAITLPDWLHWVHVSNHRPSLFGPGPEAHVVSMLVFGLLVVLAWALWDRLCRVSRSLSTAQAVQVALLLGALMIPFGWRALTNDVMEYGLWSRAMVLWHLDPIGGRLVNTHWQFAHVQSAWYYHYNPYGPMFWAVEWVMGHVGLAWVFVVWKGIAWLTWAATLPLLTRLIPDGAAAGQMLLRIWTNPLVMLEILGAAHNDVVVTLLLVAAVLLWRRSPAGRPSPWAAVLLGLDLGFKPLLGFAVPPLVVWSYRKHGLRATLVQSALAAAACLVWFVPFGSPLSYVHHNILDQAGLVGYSVASLLSPQLKALLQLFGLALLGLVSVRARATSDPLALVTDAQIVAVLAILTWFEPWYLVSLWPGLLLTSSPRLQRALTAVAALYMVNYAVVMWVGMQTVPVSVTALLAGLVAAYADRLPLLLARRQPEKQGAEDALARHVG